MRCQLVLVLTSAMPATHTLPFLYNCRCCVRTHLCLWTRETRIHEGAVGDHKYIAKTELRVKKSRTVCMCMRIPTPQVLVHASMVEGEVLCIYGVLSGSTTLLSLSISSSPSFSCGTLWTANVSPGAGSNEPNDPMTRLRSCRLDIDDT